MNESILLTIKKLLGISDYENPHFDMDIMIHINSALMTLQQLGVGPDYPFSIEDDSAEWSDFVEDDIAKFSAVKTYVYLKVKKVFDPSASSVVMAAYDEMIKEYEFRLAVRSESE